MKCLMDCMNNDECSAVSVDNGDNVCETWNFKV